jgi:HAD superfamily hydrolase (TIGR01484 family)
MSDSQSSLRSNSSALPPCGEWLLVSDIDDTLTGDDASLLLFLKAIARCPDLLVSLNSSRPAASVDQTLADWPAPFHPCAIITAMGTEVRIDGEYVTSWTARFAGWDRRPIDDLMRRLGHPPHAPEMQTQFKASFAVEPHQQDRARSALAELDQPSRIITSGSTHFDILPPLGGKDHATRFLAEHLGIPLGRLIVAGDSANDLALFQIAEAGIVVANAHADLKSAADARHAYFASASHAAGVLQGLVHHGVPIDAGSLSPRGA